MGEMVLSGREEANRHEERFGLLTDLKYLTVAYLSEALDETRADVLSPTMAQLLGIYLDTGHEGIAALHRAAWQQGMRVEEPPRIDLAAGFSALGNEAGMDGFDPFACETSLLTGALVLNSLAQAVSAAWLGEDDAEVWRAVLLPMLADDARFEGMLGGAMCFLGDVAEVRARELRALIGGPLTSTTSGEPLWSFELLQMAISRVACGGSSSRRGGFFPEGMSGTGKMGSPV